MKTLVFDTETTGLPPSRSKPDPANIAPWDRCRIVQIAWNIYDVNGALERAVCFMVKPDGFTIPPEAARIHGITTECAMAEGVPIEHVFEILRRDLSRVSTLVAHNIRFDDNVVLAELYRLLPVSSPLDIQSLIDAWELKERRCTMLMGTPPKGKWPKLVNLYQRLFNTVPDCVLHRADADVEVCAKCYFEMQKINAA